MAQLSKLGSHQRLRLGCCETSRKEGTPVDSVHDAVPTFGPKQFRFKAGASSSSGPLQHGGWPLKPPKRVPSTETHLGGPNRTLRGIQDVISAEHETCGDFALSKESKSSFSRCKESGGDMAKAFRVTVASAKQRLGTQCGRAPAIFSAQTQTTNRSKQRTWIATRKTKRSLHQQVS